MFGFTIKVQPAFGNVRAAADRAIYRNIGNAAFSIRKHIRNSIQKSDRASSPGEPVATRGKRGNVKNSIFAAIEKDNAIIGPRYSMVGDAMQAHEFGGTRYGIKYEARPTSWPGLTANVDRFGSSFAGSVGT